METGIRKVSTIAGLKFNKYMVASTRFIELEIEEDKLGIVNFRTTNTAIMPCFRCKGCVVEPVPNQMYGCAGFTSEGASVIDTDRRNVAAMMERVQKGETDLTNCGILQRVVEGRRVKRS